MSKRSEKSAMAAVGTDQGSHGGGAQLPNESRPPGNQLVGDLDPDVIT